MPFDAPVSLHRWKQDPEFQDWSVQEERDMLLPPVVPLAVKQRLLSKQMEPTGPAVSIKSLFIWLR